MDDNFFLLTDSQPRSTQGEAELVVSAGANLGYTVTVREELWIGRDPSCGLQLFDEAVSNRHCRIHRQGDLFYIEDNGSRNGTLLHGASVANHILYHRDMITCGATTLKFLCPSCPHPKKTTVAAMAALSAQPVERIETPMELEVIETALQRESKQDGRGGAFAAKMIDGYLLLQAIAQQTDWEEMFRKLLAGLPKVVPHDTAVLCRYNAKTHRAFPVMHRRPDVPKGTARILMDQDLLGQCCAERRCIAQRQADGRWALVAPMPGYDRILGVLYLETPALSDPRVALALLAGVCRQAGLALMQAELINAFRQQKLQLEEAARTIQREKSKLDCLVAAVLDGVALVTPSGEVLLANPGGRDCLASLCRCNAQGWLLEVGGVAWPVLADACTPERPPPARELVDEAGRRRFESMLFYVPLGPAVELEPGREEHGFALLFRDVTELRAKEEAIRQMQKLEAIGTLAGGLAHEFNNILATISTEAAGALEFHDVEYARTSLGHILEAAGSASSITRDLLNFAKPQASVREPADIAELLGRALNFVRQELRNQRVEIVQNLARVSAAVIDPRQIQQVFVNVLTNARDAMPDGGTLTLTLAERVGMIEIGFRDSGAGIPPEHLHRIFDPFFTTKGAYGKSRIPGTGLGLSVASGIVRGHGGTIDVESTPHQGTHVLIRLPPTPRSGDQTGEKTGLAQEMEAP